MIDLLAGLVIGVLGTILYVLQPDWLGDKWQKLMKRLSKKP